MAFVTLKIPYSVTVHSKNITLISINFLPVKNMGDLYRLDVAGSKYGNQIIPSLTIFGIETLKLKKNYIYSEIYTCQCWGHHKLVLWNQNQNRKRLHQK